MDAPGSRVGEPNRAFSTRRKNRAPVVALDARLPYVLHHYEFERARAIPANRIRVGLEFSDTSHLLRAVKAARRRFGSP